MNTGIALLAAVNLRKAAELSERMEGLTTQYRKDYQVLVDEYNQLMGGGVGTETQGADSNGNHQPAQTQQAAPKAHPNKGRRFTPEAIAKISKAQKKRWKRIKAEKQANSIGAQIAAAHQNMPPKQAEPPVAHQPAAVAA